MEKLRLTTVSIVRILIPTVALITFGCNDEGKEVADETFININDPELLSKTIVIPNSVIENGDIPARTETDGIPVLFQEGNSNFGAIAGKSFYMTPALVEGEATGMYFKINGSDQYFKILFEEESNTGGRFGSQIINSGFLKHARASSSDILEIKLPKRLSEGSFCARYAVFDQEGNTSNTIQVCIEVINERGEGSEFLIKNDWELVRLSESSSNYEFTQALGEEMEFTYEISVQCADNTYQTIFVDEIKKINLFDLSFSERGDYNYQEESFVRYLDWENSDCQQLNYLENVIKVSEKGAWSFNKDTRFLTIVTEHIIGEKAFTQLFKVKATMEDDNLIISQDIENGGKYELVMRKK